MVVMIAIAAAVAGVFFVTRRGGGGGRRGPRVVHYVRSKVPTNGKSSRLGARRFGFSPHPTSSPCTRMAPPGRGIVRWVTAHALMTVDIKNTQPPPLPFLPTRQGERAPRSAHCGDHGSPTNFSTSRTSLTYRTALSHASLTDGAPPSATSLLI